MKRKILSKTAVITLTAITATSGTAAMYYVYNQNVVAKQDNGYYSMTGQDKGAFDKEKTPISNMLILLKILNNSAQCDGEWYQEVEKCIGMLEAQIKCNANSEDDFTKELMKLQQELVNDLKKTYAQMCIENIDKLQDSYNKYHDYYYNVFEGGTKNANEKEDAEKG